MNASSHEEWFSKVTIPVIKPPQYFHKTTSDFVADDFNQIQTGMEVEHQRFGVGKVVHLEGNSKEKMATIFFQNNVGSKKIMLRYARLRIVKTNMMQEG
jgi:DNA helicase-2/ATP-dependent DNA helicase PcrA